MQMRVITQFKSACLRAPLCIYTACRCYKGTAVVVQPLHFLSFPLFSLSSRTHAVHQPAPNPGRSPQFRAPWQRGGMSCCISERIWACVCVWRAWENSYSGKKNSAHGIMKQRERERERERSRLNERDETGASEERWRAAKGQRQPAGSHTHTHTLNTV